MTRKTEAAIEALEEFICFDPNDIEMVLQRLLALEIRALRETLEKGKAA